MTTGEIVAMIERERDMWRTMAEALRLNWESERGYWAMHGFNDYLKWSTIADVLDELLGKIAHSSMTTST